MNDREFLEYIRRFLKSGNDCTYRPSYFKG